MTPAWCRSGAKRSPPRVRATRNRSVADSEWRRIKDGARLARSLGLEVHAGHGLDYSSAEAIAAVPEIAELNIGHFLVGEAIFAGLSAAVKSMRSAMDQGR